jgi:3-hydroxyisobutyrate dehydrogenase-like beta-hydroxyacid dehydrogenase
MLSVLRTTMAWNNALAIAMPKRPLAGDFSPGFMLKLAHKDCRLALAMVEALGVSAPVGRAALASLDEAMQRGLQDDDVGALLKLREEPAGVRVRLAKP